MNENGERFSIFESVGFLRCNCPGREKNDITYFS
jgi:hypothetical protein